MSNGNTKASARFAKFSLQILKYAVAIVLIVLVSMGAYRFGLQIFSTEGVDKKPGTDMTVTVEDGTSVRQLGKMLEEYRIIKDADVFYVQSKIYKIDYVEPGIYNFNTSNDNETIFKIIAGGPQEEEEATKAAE